LEKSVRDWRSYDEIAERYDPVWSARFETVARHIWARVPTSASDKLLDIGTGTGVVPRIRLEVAGAASLMVGCDRSPQMLQRAQSRVAGLHVLVADAAALPLRSNSFDVVTASFVLSHIREYRSALAEIFRVLRPGGTIAASNWARASDPYTAAWSECLAGAISKAQVQRAWAEVTPWEEHFSQRGALEDALTEAGFLAADSVTIDVQSDLTMEQFLEDRELTSSARLGRHLLDASAWAQFREAVRKTFLTRFGPSFRYSRGAFIATARKP
jgi:demethylmenaquinone methyltransferase/2-methoxy-6-polyprenyl-1,4-benzoquinol methylase